MKKYSIGYEELMSFPYEKYLEFSKIISLEAKEKKKEQDKMEEQV